MDAMKRTFEHWVDGIGPALKMLKAKPGGDNHKHWKTMREAAGFGEIAPAVVSRLLRVMEDENIDRVKAWHATLPANKRFAWCSPAAIMRHCPVFNKPAAPKKPKKETEYDKLATEHAVVLEKLHRLEREPADSTPHRREDGAALDLDQARRTYVTLTINWSDNDKAKAALELVRDLKISMMDVIKLWKATTPSMQLHLGP
jgi:hypothetical protein